jgi:SPP1 gp7 family putative phage head morphogenesis protein
MDYSKPIYNGSISSSNLPVALYQSTALELLKGVEEGAKIDYFTFEFGSLGKKTALALRENIYLFSGAKTFNYVLSCENLLLDKNGQIIPFKEFEEIVKKTNELYNKTWLEVEYNSAQIQATNIVDFKDFQDRKDTFPFLKYVTFKDKNVSEVCRRLEGVVMATDSTFWHTHSPQQHYQCRCRLEPLTDGVETKLSTKNLITPNPLFKNPAISNQIFNKEHPYYNVDSKYKAFAKTNFGLNIPQLEEPKKK